MAAIAQWADLTFEITTNTALLFDNIKMSAESETDDRTENGQKYVAWKNGKPVEISFSIILNAALGIDVRKKGIEVMSFAQTGKEGYLYAGGKKVFPFRLMMTKADVEETKTNPNGVWCSQKINATFRQSSGEPILAQTAETIENRWEAGKGNAAAASSSNKIRKSYGALSKSEKARSVAAWISTAKIVESTIAKKNGVGTSSGKDFIKMYPKK